MEDFIYSLNATMPIFLVMAAGYFLRRTGLLNENFVTVANRFNFKVTLPILLFMQISAMDLQADFDPLYFFFCIGATLASILAIWLLSARLVKDRTQVGSFIQGAYRGSAAVLGVAFIQNIYGNAGLAPLMIVAAVPLYNIFAVIILTIYGEHPAGPQNSRGSIKRTLLNIVRNPIIIGIAAGVPFSLLHLRLPAMLDKTLASFADMSTPIALVAIGAGFEGGKALARLKPTLAAARCFSPSPLRSGSAGRSWLPCSLCWARRPLSAPTSWQRTWAMTACWPPASLWRQPCSPASPSRPGYSCCAAPGCCNAPGERPPTPAAEA